MSLLTNVLKLWRTGQYLLPADSGFMVKHLFATGEQGAWYDPSDLTTLFQDTAGTVPVTAVEQPVGLMLDKARPIVTNGAERMNVLPSEAANWAGGDNTVVGNKIIPNTTNGWHGQYKTIPMTGLDYIIKVKAKAAGYSKFYISDASSGRVRAAYDLANGTVISAASNIPHDAAIVYLGAGVYELSVKVNAVTTVALAITPYPDTGATLNAYYASFAGDGVSGVEVYAVDARLVTQADTLPRYQYTPANTWSRFIGSTHASQATSTKRPIYSRRVNLLTKTEQFDNAAWQKGSGGLGTAPVVTPNAAMSPLGDMTADSVYFTLNGGTVSADRSYITQSFNSSIGTAYTAGVSVKANGPTDIGKNILFRHAAGSTYTVITLSNEWQAVSSTETAIGATTSFLIELRAQSGGASDTCTVDIWGARAQLATDARLPYQRVNTPTDYDADPAKFPGYLRFDGVDDALSTGNIDFTGTDKMTVWAGVTRLTQEQSIVCELSNTVTNNGMFHSGISSGNYASFISRGTGGVYPNAYAPLAPPPVSAVIGGSGSIGDQISTARVNGVSINSNLNQGTGNYGNYPLYIGTRGGTSLFFNGRLYSLIVRGAQSSLSQIEATEAYIKQKMRLP